jgi:hypothetical protein
MGISWTPTLYGRPWDGYNKVMNKTSLCLCLHTVKNQTLENAQQRPEVNHCEVEAQDVKGASNVGT